MPSALYLTNLDDAVFKSVVIKITLVSAGVIYLLFCQFMNFKNLIRQRSTLSHSKTSIAEQAKELREMNVELKQISNNNHNLANLDKLTSLPNRRSFFTQLNAIFDQHQGLGERKFIVGFLDLDGFKRINDVFGHPAGDNLLEKASKRLSYILGEGVVLARLGGDEFGLILTRSDDVNNVLEIGGQICDSMKQAFDLKEGSVQIGATVGFAEYPAMATSTKLLFERGRLCPLFFKTE